MDNAAGEKRLGVIGIVVKEREAFAPKVNEILSRHGQAIIGRIGLPYKDRGVSVISLIVEATTDEVGAITGRLGMIEGVQVKSLLV
ncbi:MAG: TM1266 family iron-only hydrogenase system putative regulator [Desulfovibrio sp.]|uniref:TM1266 family iron-only hydrogenase system putative regulator n=1 Tax=Desulfovibrio sp. 7SRBS1 TaxID=3378064 RepID=UPI003B3E3F03